MVWGHRTSYKGSLPARSLAGLLDNSPQPTALPLGLPCAMGLDTVPNRAGRGQGSLLWMQESLGAVSQLEPMWEISA